MPLASDRQVNEKPFKIGVNSQNKIGVNSQNPPVLTHSGGRRPIKIDLALDVSLYTFLQILSVHSFEKTPLAQALFDRDPNPSFSAPSNQMNLFTN